MVLQNFATIVEWFYKQLRVGGDWVQ